MVMQTVEEATQAFKDYVNSIADYDQTVTAFVLLGLTMPQIEVLIERGITPQQYLDATFKHRDHVARCFKHIHVGDNRHERRKQAKLIRSKKVAQR